MNHSKHQRKKPSQTRSKAMVDALVEAGARVFSTSGFEGATTNAVAELAGVSIGSLYQYFPNKRAVLYAVHERHIIELWITAGAACREARALPWPKALEHFVAATAAYNLKSGRLFGIFQKELPGLIPSSPEINAAKVVYDQELSSFLFAHQTNVHVDIDRAVQMIPIIGKGVVTAAFQSRPEDLKNGRLAAEVTRVLLTYLSAPESAVQSHPPLE